MNLEQFAGVLTGLVPDLSAAELADALWLAERLPRGGEGAHGAPAEPGFAVVPGLDDSGTTASALELARALRPLKRTARSGRHVILDEAATADRIARDGVRLPVLKAAPEPWLDVALVVDDGPSMAIWHDTIAEFQTVLENAGAFRDVRMWRLNADAHVGASFSLRSGGSCGQSVTHSPGELHDAVGRRVVLVFSDGTGRAWRDRRMSRLLEQWGKAGHVSVVQPLPQRLWQRCAPSVAAVKIHATKPAMANTNFSVRYRHAAGPGDGYHHRYGQEPSPDDGVPIPVLNLEPRWLTRWAQLVTGEANWADIPVMFTGRAARCGTDLPRTASALERVTRFRATASREAFQLAGYLAFAPMTPAIMRVVQQTMLPSSRTSHLAEVLLGGLLIRSPADGGIR